MPLGFGLVLQLLVALAIAIVIVPLVRKAERREWTGAIVAALVLYFGSTLAYGYLSEWPWPGEGAAAPVVEQSTDIAAMKAATEREPQNPQAWAMLGVALLNSGQAGDAAAALERADTLSGGTNPDLRLALVDALASSGDENRGRVNQIVEELLAIAPGHPKALLYGAELAFSRQDYTLARERWQRLLDRAGEDSSPEAANARGVLVRRIALADQHLGANTATPTEEEKPGASTSSGLTILVSVDPALAARLPGGAPLFVLAREPGAAGPPVAVVRRAASDLPLEVTLSDRDAMLPGRVLSGFETIEIVARVALGGAPTATSGDLYGAATVTTARDDAVRIVISEVYP